MSRVTKSSEEVRERVIDRDGMFCWYCGEPVEQVALDHKIPKSSGGETVAENLVVVCVVCNSTKLKKTVGEFREYLRLKRSPVARARMHLLMAQAELPGMLDTELDPLVDWLRDRVPPMRFYGEGERDREALYLVRTEESRNRSVKRRRHDV